MSVLWGKITGLFKDGGIVAFFRKQGSGSILVKIGLSIFFLILLAFVIFYLLTERNLDKVSSKRESLTASLLKEYTSLLDRTSDLQKEYQKVLRDNSELQFDLGNSKRQIMMLEGESMIDAFNSEIGELEAEQNAIMKTLSSNLTTLIETSMLSGDADSFQEVVENMEKMEGVRSIKIYRTFKTRKRDQLGEEAFRDNKAINRVNKVLGTKAFKRRKAKKTHRITSMRKSTLAVARGKPDELYTVNGKLKGEKVTFIYTALKNKKECRACHGKWVKVNGISEIAFSAEHIEKAGNEANEEKDAFREEQKLTTADLDQKIKTKRNSLEERIDSLEKEMADEMKAAEKLKRMLEEEKGGVERIEKAASKSRIFATVIFTLLLIVALIALMKRLIISPLSNFRVPFKKIAEGDLTQRLDDTRGDELGDVARWFNSFMVMLNEAMGKMAKATTTVADSSNEISTNSQEVTKNVQNQVAQTDNIARAINEISAAIEDVSANAASESALAEKAMEITEKGGETIANAIVGMGKIEKTVKESAEVIDKLGGSSEKIGEVIEVINDIADQTNLLALNAAIEAARAGEHGRGFAVVADEVRKLAERTTRATGEVAKTIEEIQENTKTAVVSMEAGTDEVAKGASLINDAGASFKEIVDIITQLAGKANEIAASVEQQAVTTKQVSENTEVVTKVANDVAAGAEVTSNSSNKLSELAGELNELVGKFKL